MIPEATVRAPRKVSWWRRYRVDARLALSVVVLLAACILAIFAPQLTGDPIAQGLRTRLMPPAWIDGGSTQHLLGTDHLGRDVLSRVAHGGRVSLTISAMAVLLAGLVGTVLGIIAGFMGAWADNIIMRLIDVQMAFPVILLVILLLAIFKPSLTSLVVILGFATWIDYAKLIRAEVLRKREETFVEAAGALGAGKARVMFLHILPNVVPSLIILVTLTVPRIILVESALSWLGLGVPPPMPSWGGMVADANDYLGRAWWLPTMPGAAIVAVVLSIGFIGNWLRDLLDPHARANR